MVSTPAATVWMPLQRQAVVTTNVKSGLTYFQTAASQRAIDPGIQTRADVRAGRLMLFGQVAKARQNQRANVELDTRVRFVTTGVAAGLSGLVRPRLTASLSVDRNSTAFAGDAKAGTTSLRQSLDRSDHGVRFELRERLSSLTTVGVAMDTRQDRFAFSPERDANSYKFATLASFGQKALVSGDFEVGFRHFAQKNAVAPAFNGLVAKAALSSKVLQSTQVSGAWDRDVQFSYDVLRSYFVSNQFSFSIRRQLTGRYDVVGNAGWGRANYRGAQGTSSSGSPNLGTTNVVNTNVAARTDVTSSYGADIGYRLNPRARAGFAVAVEHRSVDSGVVLPFDAVRAGISFSYGL